MKAAAKGGTVGQCRAEAAHRRSSVHLEEHVDLRQREDVERALNAQWRLGSLGSRVPLQPPESTKLKRSKAGNLHGPFLKM